MEPTFIKFMYVTFPNVEDAKRICTPLIQEKLAACLNILPSSHSICMWNGQLKEEQEVIVLIKTRDHNISEIQEYIKKRHPYDVPCIVDIDVTGGNAAFLNWIRSNA